MTRSELEKIKTVKGEIKTLQRQIVEVGDRIVSDTVTGCTPTRPDKHVIRITGIDTRKSDQLHKRMLRKLEELQDLLCDLEEWIEEVEDPEMRNILRLRYRNGLGWRQIAHELGYADESVPRKRHNRFLEMTDKSEK